MEAVIMDRYDTRPDGTMRKIYGGEWVKFEDIPTWIPVDEPPKESGNVLVFREINKEAANLNLANASYLTIKEIAFYDADDGEFNNDATGADITESVTHYQYLPEDPE